MTPAKEKPVPYYQLKESVEQLTKDLEWSREQNWMLREDNQRLEIENRDLRRRLKELEAPPSIHPDVRRRPW